MRIAAIIAAAGLGRRMGGRVPKPYLEIGGRPIICHTLDRFRAAKGLDEVIVVVESGRESSFQDEILARHGYLPHWRVVAGGSVRQESVTNGMEQIPAGCDVVVVHDGVRPFVTSAQIEEAAAAAARDGACIIAARIKETIKRVGSDGCIEETVDRERLFAAQTPQCFQRELLAEALARARRDGFVGTDEASLVERMGVRVTIVEGDARNIKITTPEDLAIAEGILANGAWTG